jgi:hypothetical protein
MVRDNNGRLRRRSWLVSKLASRLRLQLELFAAYRNWHRQRHNDDSGPYTPAMDLGLISRRLEIEELLAWRQDWGVLSIHPASAQATSTVRDRAA